MERFFSTVELIANGEYNTQKGHLKSVGAEHLFMTRYLQQSNLIKRVLLRTQTYQFGSDNKIENLILNLH